MKEGPDIARLGALIGDPARANMLTALMSGKALTATELAGEAGVTPATASSHLGKLESAGLLLQRKQGRHRYFALADDEVGAVLEAMMGLAQSRGHTRTRTGPKDPALRKARICYDHMAGEMAVDLFDSLIQQGFIVAEGDQLNLTTAGMAALSDFGIADAALRKSRRPVCRACLDWSARRSHLAGTLGAALLQSFYDRGWAQREEGTRIIRFSAKGETAFRAHFPVTAA